MNLNRTLFRTLGKLGLTIAATAAISIASVKPAASSTKKLIALTMICPDTKTVLDNLPQIEEQTPFDGITLEVIGTDDEGQKVNLGYVFSNRPWKREWFAQSISELKQIRARSTKLNNNFIRVLTNPGIIDWYDDAAWEQVIDHWRMVAWVAKETGMKGILFDPENYSHLPQFQYTAHLGSTEETLPVVYQDPLRMARLKNPETRPSFSDFEAKARERGKQLIEAVAGEYPDITIYGLWMNSLNLMAAHNQNPQAALRTMPYGLYSAFINGWLDAAPASMTFIDGCEWGYGYDSEHDFLQAANEMRNTALSLVAPENRLKHSAQVQTSFGLYLDPYVNPPTATYYMTPKGTTVAERLRLRTQWALASSTEYVWIYGEQYRWWPTDNPAIKPENWNDTIPGITPALRSTTSQQKQHEYLFEQLKSTGKANNLIQNGEFLANTEKPTTATGGAADWVTLPGLPAWNSWNWDGDKASYTWDPTISHNTAAGNGSARVQVVGKGGCLIQSLSVNPGETYFLRAWTRAQTENTGLIRVRWKTPDEIRWTQEGRDVMLVPSSAKSGEWGQISGTITVPPGAGKLILLLAVDYQTEADAIWFDSVELYKITP